MGEQLTGQEGMPEGAEAPGAEGLKEEAAPSPFPVIKDDEAPRGPERGFFYREIESGDNKENTGGDAS